MEFGEPSVGKVGFEVEKAGEDFLRSVQWISSCLSSCQPVSYRITMYMTVI